MIPSAYVPLAELPLTNSGKVDYGALPPPDDDDWAKDAVSLPPGTANEVVLAEIWTDLLGLRTVGVHDDFFGIGGHSLLATQLASRIGRAFDVDLPLHIIFENPTVARLGQYIDALLVTPAVGDRTGTERLLEEDRL